ncbi:MAG: esterase family protein [Chitinophagaceae bacterium]|nr:esterase family protein [Chitinophagaceae bacterium]
MTQTIVTLLLCFCLTGLNAATVDSIEIYSTSMKRNIPCIVIKPNKFRTAVVKAFPVVYLLHGYSGNAKNWISKVPELKILADEHQLLIVCPDGGYSSWYFDSPIDSSMRYETYIAVEVPAYIDEHYPTIRNRKARAITGLSMGGHGGLFLGFRHADSFGACGSMSGGVELYSSRNRFDLAKRIGDTVQHAENWRKYSVVNTIENYPKDSLAIIIDCGTEDFFYSINRNLHEKLLKLKIPHDYIERPGKHDWAYWANAVRFQLLFFSNYFERQGFIQKR